MKIEQSFRFVLTILKDMLSNRNGISSFIWRVTIPCIRLADSILLPYKREVKDSQQPFEDILVSLCSQFWDSFPSTTGNTQSRGVFDCMLI